uniref:Selenoprotein F n=1 Tax=Caenorhabditis tropicalis TaxID=1561998 RepID=A0A1I7TQD9_9PELO
MWVLVLLVTLIPTSFCQLEEYKIDVDECKAAGFNPETLKCGLCDRLSDYHLETLISDCQQCCIKEEEFKHEKYPIAILEVCECNLARFPQVQAFVHKDMAQQFGGKVRVKHVRGVRPQVALKDAEFKTKEVLSVEKWDTDTLIDFFNQWLE